MGKNQHVTKHEKGGQVKGVGNNKATQIFKTQVKAIEKAREIAINQKSEVVIHGKNGQIRNKIAMEMTLAHQLVFITPKSYNIFATTYLFKKRRYTYV